jgi:hypothetical protein
MLQSNIIRLKKLTYNIALSDNWNDKSDMSLRIIIIIIIINRSNN